MPNLPISQLPSITAASSNSLLVVVETGDTNNIKKDDFLPRAFAQYIGTIDQSLTANTPTNVNLDTVSYEWNISLSSNTITFISGGTYLISASYQFSQGAGSADIAFWFKKNGNELSNSATHQTISSNSKQTAMVSIIENFNIGETFNLRIQSTSSNTVIDNIVQSGSIPDAPGIIVSITQIYG